MEEAKSLMTVADCKKTSEFIEKAIEFYCGYLRNSTDDYVPEIVLSTLRGLMNENENRHNGSLFRIDRKIGGTDTEMSEAPDEPKKTQTSEVEENFEPYKPKIRKSGTGCVTMINDHLYEGRFTPRVNGKRISKNVYAKTREECEEKLAELIKTMKAEIAEMKKASNS